MREPNKILSFGQGEAVVYGTL